MNISPDKNPVLLEAAKRVVEQRNRERKHVQAMRDSFREFIIGAWPEVEPRPFVHNWHIDAIADHLQAVYDGRIRNLLINICPGSAKSILVSVLWPAWMWVVRPEWQAIFTSYSGDLVLRDAVRARNLIESKWYRETFDITWGLSEEQNAKSNYQNTEKGSRFSASVNSRVMGFRAECVICDDPLNSKEQYSDTALDECVFWWDNVISSRFNDMSTGSKVIIMQRLSDRDLSAHVLRQGGYVHLNLPTEFEPENKCVTSIGWEDPRKERGELMFPAMFPRDVVERIKTVELGPDGFASQHQQHPVPVGGGMIKAHWWRYWEPRGANLPPITVTLPDGTIQTFKPIELPEKFDAIAQSWDMSFTDSGTSDYVVGIVGAAKKADRFITAMVRDRMDLPTTVKAVRQLSFDNPLAYTKYVEIKANGPAVMQSLRHEIGGFIGVNPDGNKIARAASGTPAVASGNWYLPHPLVAGWVKDFIAEAAAFPLGSHDDMVDAWSQLAKQFINVIAVEEDDDAVNMRIRGYKEAGWTA